MSQQKQNDYQNFDKVISLLALPFREIFYGVRYHYIPWVELIGASVIALTTIMFRFDQFAFSFFEIGYLYPYAECFYWLYVGFVCTLPFFSWGIIQGAKTLKISRQLARAFKVSGLINNLQKMPALISDVRIDSATKKLKLTSAYLPIKKFEEARPFLESALHVYIEKIKASIDRGTVELIYSPYPMPEMVKYVQSGTKSQTEFWIGNTRAGQKIGDFRDTPHLLIAGQTGGGKSTFVRQMLAGLYLKDKLAEFTLIDLKGGLEAAMFEELPRVQIAHELSPSVQELAKLEKIIRTRMSHYKSETCKDLEEFQKKVDAKDLKNPQIDKKLLLARRYIVIDEAAEMFLAGQGRDSDAVALARKVVSLIARQGRSVGIHLIIATQRPDSKALDPQVKANLTGVLCFPIANDASSITVLGNGRATDLPDVKGRAIWKNGMELVEVQTPYLSPEEFKAMMPKEKPNGDESKRSQAPSRSVEVEAAVNESSLDSSWEPENNQQSLL